MYVVSNCFPFKYCLKHIPFKPGIHIDEYQQHDNNDLFLFELFQIIFM